MYQLGALQSVTVNPRQIARKGTSRSLRGVALRFALAV
jgi:hypothetical protein